MMRMPNGLLLALLAPVALAAQDAIPADWTYRLDGEQRVPGSGAVADGGWAYQAMPPGWHITTTADGVTLYPKARHVMEGEWGVEVELFLFPDPSDQGVGIVLLPTTETEHKGELRLLLRRDGQVSAEVWHAGETQVLVPWTRDTAADAHDGEEVKQYVLRVMHQGDHLTFAVNGRQMLSLPLGANVQHPIAGLRAGPGLNLHVSRFDLVKPLAPPRQRQTSDDRR